MEFSHDIHTAIVELIPSFINLTQPRHHRQRAVLTQRQSINYCNWLFQATQCVMTDPVSSAQPAAASAALISQPTAGLGVKT